MTIDLQVLGRLLFAQENLDHLPNKQLNQFVAAILSEIPGISEARVTLYNDGDAATSSYDSKNSHQSKYLQIKTLLNSYGQVELIDDGSNLLIEYQPFIQNLLNVMARILENRNITKELQQEIKQHQATQEQLKTINNELEARVLERTQHLSKEIKERKKIEELRIRLITILESAKDFIAFGDVSGNTLYINKSGRQMMGFGLTEDLSNLGIEDYHPPETVKVLQDIGFPTAKKNGTWQGETELLDRDGNRIPTSQILVSHKTENGDTTHFSTIARDISNQKHSEQNLILAKEAAESANKAKSEFLAVMSHEIRTPLNAILGMTEVAKEIATDDKQSLYLDIIERSGNSLLTLIEDILDLSYIDSGQLNLVNTVVNIQELTREVLDIHSQSAKNKNIDLSCSINIDTPRSFHGDHKRLRQILLNLIGNAIKFTNQGNIELVVSCPTPQALQFSIFDTGIGIPQEKQKLIFAPFSQADSSNTRQHGGVGLGLAICRKLIKAMNGKIWLESEEGKGSRFHFSIPLSDEDQNRIPNSSNKELTLTDKRENKRSTNILLAEDNQENAMVIDAFLKSSPYSLFLVKDGEKAVDKIQSGEIFDLIIMDIQMPTMDGLTATRLIREWEEEQGQPQTPIVALSAYAMEGDEENSLAAGCNIHVKKPVSKAKLVQIIDQFTDTN
ncbi:MAG: response regulator [Magnetococcales bacterium]|nr:response regulator [Magnetococcales bacterium]